jgi:ABC-type transport system involved in multi-copper enzyme maturation permease subunit
VKAVTKIIRAELLKLRKRSLTWILLYVLIGIMVLLHSLLYLISKITIPGQTLPGTGNLQSLLGLPMSIPFALTLLTSFGAVLTVILTASSIGNEYNWRTIRIALISSESRFKFLGAKLISIAIFILIGMVIGLATGFVMGLITTAIGGNSFDFGFLTGGYLWDQFLQFWRTFFVILPFMLFASLFAVVGRSAMPGIAVGIGILFLEPIITSFMTLAGGWVAKIPDYLFTANVNAINALNNLPIPGKFSGGMIGSSSQTPSVSHAFAVLSVYIVIFICVAFYIFRKRDVTG